MLASRRAPGIEYFYVLNYRLYVFQGVHIDKPKELGREERFVVGHGFLEFLGR